MHILIKTPWGELVRDEDRFIEKLNVYVVRTENGRRKCVAFSVEQARAIYPEPADDVKVLKRATKDDLTQFLKVHPSLSWPESWGGETLPEN